MDNSNYIAIGDLGSNSFRLLICRNLNGHIQLVDSMKEMIHFAAGLDEHNMLNQASQERALKCLQSFGERLYGFKPNQVRVVATNTFRVAKNIDEFLPKAEKVLGFPIETIGGSEEARLIYTGIIHTLPQQKKKILIVDIGGGSTEFACGSEIKPELTESLNMGCVSYSQQYFSGSEITEKLFNNAINAARANIQRISKSIDKAKWKTAIGSSGTAKAIRDLYINDFPKDETFSYDFLITLKNYIIKSGSIHKAKLIGLKSNRIDVFVGGLAIMIAIFKELGIKKMMTTDAGLRDGVLYDFIGRQLNQDMREETVMNFQNQYLVNQKQAIRIEKIALNIFNLLNNHNPSDKWFNQWQQYLAWASRLHEIGLAISHSAYHKHSAYIIENSDLPGFSRKDQKTVASIVLAHRYDLKKAQDLLVSKEMCYTIIALRLATIFCRARHDITLPDGLDISLNEKSRVLTLIINKNWLLKNPLISNMLDKEINYWENIGYDFHIK